LDEIIASVGEKVKSPEGQFLLPFELKYRCDVGPQLGPIGIAKPMWQSPDGIQKLGYLDYPQSILRALGHDGNICHGWRWIVEDDN
jgi:hypothetical protein